MLTTQLYFGAAKKVGVSNNHVQNFGGVQTPTTHTVAAPMVLDAKNVFIYSCEQTHDNRQMQLTTADAVSARLKKSKFGMTPP